MNWSIDDAVEALGRPKVEGAQDEDLLLPLYDSITGCGIGIDGTGAGALVLPGNGSLRPFETTALKFEPWCDTINVQGSVVLAKRAVLRCRFDRSDAQVVRIVAGVLTSLVDLQTRFGDAGEAIFHLRTLFGEGFNANIDRSAVLGLLGELIVISSSPDPGTAVEMWHVDADDRYDFSIHTYRLEVKTSTRMVREHRFTSRQLPPTPGIDVWIASVQLAEVAVGTSVAQLFRDLSNNLRPELVRKVSDIIVETLKLPPAAVTSPAVDLQTSTNGIMVFPASAVPTPLPVPGASDIQWTALLNEYEGYAGLSASSICRLFWH